MSDPVRATRPRPSSGVTLLELLVAMGIIVVLMGIAVPMVSSALDRRRLSSVAEEIVGAFLMARAHAQAEGTTVEIVLIGGADDRAPMRLLAREIELHAPPFEEDSGPPPLARGWADFTIAWPLRVSSVDAAAARDEDAADDAGERAQPSDGRPGAGGARGRAGVWSSDNEVTDRQRVVLFAADGSALLSARIRVNDADGRFVDIVINPFTGLPRLDDQEDRGAAPARTTAPAEDGGDA